MTLIIWLIIYIAGAVANYFLLKKIFYTVDGVWEGSSKYFSYIFSLGSWISFFALMLAWFINKLNND